MKMAYWNKKKQKLYAAMLLPVIFDAFGLHNSCGLLDKRESA